MHSPGRWYERGGGGEGRGEEGRKEGEGGYKVNMQTVTLRAYVDFFMVFYLECLFVFPLSLLLFVFFFPYLAFTCAPELSSRNDTNLLLM